MTGMSASGSLCVLVTNTNFSLRTGSELYVRDLALALQRMGHSPVVYSPRLGDLAADLRARAVPVVDDLQSLGRAPDLIHGQHHMETMTALAMFPDTPAIYACHGCLPWQETPPVHPRILQYLAVNEAVRDHLAFAAGIPQDQITLALNFVDLERFQPRPTLPARPSKALVFSNYASEANYVGVIRECCARRGISVDVIGYASGNPSNAPEAVLGDYHLIFARGRAAIEAIAVGAAVICCDHEGMSELVTPGNLEYLRRNNFGLRILDRPLRADLFDAQLDRYDPADAAEASARIRASAGLDLGAARIVECYERVIERWRASGERASESAPLSRYLRDASNLTDKLAREADYWRHGHSQLIGEVESTQASLAQSNHETNVLRDQVDRLCAQAGVDLQNNLDLQSLAGALNARLHDVTAKAAEISEEAGRLRAGWLALRGELAQARAESATLAAQAETLRGESDALRLSLQSWQAEHASSVEQRESLVLALLRSREEAATSRITLESVHALEREQWRQAIEDARTDHAAQLAAIGADLGAASSAHAAVVAELVTTQQALAASTAEASRLDAATRQLEASIETMRGTASWRLRERLLGFAPLRAGHRLLRALLGHRRRAAAAIARVSAKGAPSLEADTGEPTLACVVMSLGSPALLVDAVQSLLSQHEAVEIVVVNSGGGNPLARLREAGIDVKVVHRNEVLYPGAARNLGIAATRAPFVAFLAADCRAEPGWVRARLERHLAGARAVSSAVTPARPRNLWSWVSYLNLFALRMPGVDPANALHYGVSYERGLFEQHGMFDESLRSGEDSEFNQRLVGVRFDWTPEVRSAHAHPTHLLELLRDQFGRGARIAAAWERLSGRPSRRLVAVSAFRRVPALLRTAWRAAEPGQRAFIALATLSMPPAIVAYALGALCGDAPARPSAQPEVTRPRLLALLTFHNEMRYLPGYFQNLSAHVDGIIALDDGSDDGSGAFVELQPAVSELIRLPRRDPHVWDEPRNRRLLVEAAHRHGADWLVVVDADERVERDFRARADGEIARAQRDGTLVLTAVMRELWNHPDHFRSDGIWNMKRPARLFHARKDHEFDDRAFHGHWAPLNSLSESTCREADLIIYHLRMLTEDERRQRREKYQRLDPERRFQAIGYDYLTDTSELRLERLPEQREYEPLHPV